MCQYFFNSIKDCFRAGTLVSLCTKVNSPICNSNLGQSVNSSTKSLISLLIMSFSTLSFVVIVVGFMLVVVVEVSES